MAHGVCPWWLGYLLASPIRRLAQDPNRILAPFVEPGMTVVEPGPGMGFFTLELGRLVGPGGRVIAIDLQPKMLASLARRARRAGLSDRIETRVVSGDGLGVDDLMGKVDFALVFAMIHELPEGHPIFAEMARALRPGGKLLVAEPMGHVSDVDFGATLASAEQTGFRVLSRPPIRRSLTALLERN